MKFVGSNCGCMFLGSYSQLTVQAFFMTNLLFKERQAQRALNLATKSWKVALQIHLPTRKVFKYCKLESFVNFLKDGLAMCAYA